MKLDVKELISKLVNTPMIVEQGTSGIWTYRKWSDGTAECWGQTSNISITTSAWAAWGNLYEVSLVSTVTPFPTSLFIELPVINTVALPTAGYGLISLELAGGFADKDNAPRVYAVRANKPTGTITARVQFYAIGKWK